MGKKMNLKLKPCPSCGSSRVRFNDGSGWSSCDNVECLLDGPHSDPTGAKWNALPRRTDAPAGMSDGELIARAVMDLSSEVMRVHATVLRARITDPERAFEWLRDNFRETRAELDRRAAARKEATK